MTRKDYQLIAQAIADTRETERQMGADGKNLLIVNLVLETLTRNLIVGLWTDNPSFDPKKFRALAESTLETELSDRFANERNLFS